MLFTATTEPHWLTQFVPSILLAAMGVSLVLPQLGSAAVQGLPPDSLGAGSAVNQASRNLGGTLGVALVIAFTGESSAMEGFRQTWWLLVATGVTVSALSFFLPGKAPSGVPPVALAAE